MRAARPDHLTTRRGFLRRGATLAGAAALPAHSPSRSPTTQTTATRSSAEGMETGVAVPTLQAQGYL